MVDTIKCGRNVYELKDGDTVMDNGRCYQFLSRRIQKGFHAYHPLVSKKSFAVFYKNINVEINHDHSYGQTTILYRYTITK